MSPLLNVLQGKNSPRTPVWLMRQAGRYLPEYREVRASKKDFIDLCTSPKDAVEVTLQPLRRFDLDAAILFSDILMVPFALGMKLTFTEGRGPEMPPLVTHADVQNLSLSTLLPRLSPVFETVSRLREQLPDDKALIGFAGSPWTVACYMLEGRGSKDFAKAKKTAYQNPQLFADVMALLVESTILYLRAQSDAGAQVIKLFDSWAGIVPACSFHQWVIAPTTAIVKALKETHPHVPIIGFPKGVGLQAEIYARETGVDAIACDAHTPRSWITQNLQPLLPVQGNLDNHLLAYDSKGAVAETQQILRDFSAKPFIFNLGHGVIPETPIENIRSILHAIRSAA